MLYSDGDKAETMYSKLLAEYESLVKKLDGMINTVSLVRTIIFLMGIGLIVLLYKTGHREIVFPAAAGCLFIFIVMIVLHVNLKLKRKYNSILSNINDESLKRISGEWKTFEDDGTEYIDENHAYSYDLDIFGKASLFQWINTTKTYTGRNKLKDYLISPSKDSDSIRRRQESILELSKNLKFRQALMAEGMMNGNAMSNPEDLYSWSQLINTSYLKIVFVILSRISPIIAVTLIVLSFMDFGITYHYPVMMIIIQIIILRIKSKDTENAFKLADKYKDNIQTYERLIKLIEQQDFSSDYLKCLHRKLLGNKGDGASRQIKSLKKIVEMFSMRYSELYFIFNMITLWDFHCMTALERWKLESGRDIQRWLDIIGELEALSSLSIIGFDNKSWVMPAIVNHYTGIEAADIGHPLLSENRVCNSLNINVSGEVMLITGSNMSGKSTFLRTTGINLVLAYAGTFVCASQMKCSAMDIYTSMRTSDNLNKNISSFYAELIRIKTIIEACKEGKRVFFLLDEIFKGTNSRDRHTGARILIRKLSSMGAQGLVSTHDLELADMEREYHDNLNIRIRNYHFREHYSEDKIYFDYKLLPGVSDTRNAVYLMKLAGIDFNEENKQ